MKMLKILLSVLLFSFVVSVPAHAAKKFSNTYIEFSIPDSWSCKEEGGQHVCQPINPEQRKEAIVVMAAKYKGPEDELKNYMTKLNEKREVKDVKGKSYTSKNQYTKWNSLLGTVWVDSQHEDREVPGFITRYLATVQKGVGIVVTFSAHKSKFSQYSSDFYQMVNSLRISNNIPAAPADKSTDLTRLGSGVLVGNLEKAKKAGEAPSQVQIQVSQESNLTMYIAILGAAIIIAVFLVIRKRRRRK